MAVRTIMFHPLGVYLLKFRGLMWRPPQLDLMIISPRTTFHLDILQFILTQQIVISLLSCMRPQQYMEFPTTRSIHNIPMSLVWMYIYSKHHVVKLYIHAGDQCFPRKFDKTLIYIPIQEPNQWEFDNLTRVITTLDSTQEPAYFNGKLYEKNWGYALTYCIPTENQNLLSQYIVHPYMIP